MPDSNISSNRLLPILRLLGIGERNGFSDPISHLPSTSTELPSSTPTLTLMLLLQPAELLRPCWLQIPSARRELAQLSSSDTPVVVMKPTEYGDCVNAAVRLEWTRNRLLVPETLVRTRFIVEAHVLGDDAPEGILTEDAAVVEHLSPECADEALSKGIHVRRTYRRAHDAYSRRPQYPSEATAELRVVSADDNLWRAVHCGVPGLLRAPLVGWRVRHRSMEDRSATQVQEEEHEHLTEPHFERLREVTA